MRRSSLLDRPSPFLRTRECSWNVPFLFQTAPLRRVFLAGRRQIGICVPDVSQIARMELCDEIDSALVACLADGRESRF